MLVSLNWIRDFVDLPADVDARALAERFTMITAEVEEVHHVTCAAEGLVAGEIKSVQSISDDKPLFAVTLSIGKKNFDTVSIAEGLKVGDRVIFAPPGATLPGVGKIAKVKTAGGRDSEGMIVPGDALSLPTIGQRAVWLPPRTEPGTPINMSLFDDWVIAVDNKSITHRPDLWGHYGIAREIAAIYGLTIKPYPVVPLEELQKPDLPEIPIVIDDPVKCPRYSCLRFTGVAPQPSPLAMQVRLAHVGLRPIDILVDLTNYIMVELGQPMHAFDAATVDRIEVGDALPGEQHTTLDGVKRTLPTGALMIQCNRRSIALAGIMGGKDTEITERTTDMLLESANFEGATIRRCAAAMGHRTDASARFEKSLDPHNTVLGIQRFIYLARPELPGLTLTSRLSDLFPHPPAPTTIRVDPRFVSRYVGRQVSVEEIRRILTALHFAVEPDGEHLAVKVPAFRATKDIRIEADIIEEVARYIGYNAVEPTLPQVAVRYVEPDAMSVLERRTLNLFCIGGSYAEIHRYIWFDAQWLRVLGYDPGETINLRNPAAAGLERLRTTLIPGLLAAVDLNRRHFDRFDLIEIGSVFCPGKFADPTESESRNLALAVVAPGRKAAQEDALVSRLKTDLETYARQILGGELRYSAGRTGAPWEHEGKTADIHFGERCVGRLTVVPKACKSKIDEHLAAWSIALAEIDLSALADREPVVKKLVPVPVYPTTDVDFSVLAPAERRYTDIESALRQYDHALLRRLAFVDSFEGGSVPVGQRSFTFRATIAEPSRTLTDDDIQNFRADFIAYLERNELRLRS